ncbi:MAG: maleylpyruvate isomerase family mycothiol-dependent enzyme [Streptosporangiales bacterium]|nr:maleylpyruvate isomerase family mycothiol-dependent enzyme [Streptosporangiales bacterium]
MSWNFLDPASRSRLDAVVAREADGLLALSADPERWRAPTASEGWTVQDVVGHMVDTTEGYFVSFDAARGGQPAAEPLGVRDMAKYVDDGAKSFRPVGQAELLGRLRADFDRFAQIRRDVTDEEWTGLNVPHKYMGPVPAAFYTVFQLVDYAVHAWDIREGAGRPHGLAADTADLLVPLSFIVWQSTCDTTGVPPYSLGIRILSGANAGDTVARVTEEGIVFEPGDLSGLPGVIEFDPASFVLTAFGRINGGTHRGDTELLGRFCNLFFRI